MTQTTCHMSISLDGFAAGPNQDRENPLGVGGLEVHRWHLGEITDPGAPSQVARTQEAIRRLEADGKESRLGTALPRDVPCLTRKLPSAASRKSKF